MSISKNELEITNQLNLMQTYWEVFNANQTTNIYSVDSMIAYQKLFKPNIEDVVLSMNQLKDLLLIKVWAVEINKKIVDISPYDVILDINNKNYAYHKKKIMYANLTYPIYIKGNVNNIQIIDGYHRLSKLYIDNFIKKSDKEALTKVILFDQKLLSKFLIIKDLQQKKIPHITFNDVIINFYDNFCGKR